MSQFDMHITPILDGIVASLFDYPCPQPQPLHQPIRDACASYKEGKRDPELLMFLTCCALNAIANNQRAMLVEGINALVMRIGTP